MVADGARRLGGVPLVPAIAAKVVAELGDLLAVDLHQLEPAVADQTSVDFRAYRERTEAVLALLLEAALQPAAHVLAVEGRLVERGHDGGIAEDLQEPVKVAGDHRAQHKALRLEGRQARASGSSSASRATSDE